VTGFRNLWVVLSLALVGFVASSCGSTTEVSGDVAQAFDRNDLIADLTPQDGSEDIRRDILLPALAQAEAAGTELRVVVTGFDAELESAKAIVDRYGGTALSYQVNQASFEAASRDLSAAQLERAIDQARVELDIGDSVAAFVSVLEAEGVEAPGSSLLNRLIIPLLLAAAAFMLWGAWSYVQARKRRARRQRAFMERRRVLSDWAAQLAPEVEALRGGVAVSADNSAQSTWQEAQEFVSSIVPAVEGARTASDLDVAEMRISRMAIKLRDLRSLIEK